MTVTTLLLPNFVPYSSSNAYSVCIALDPCKINGSTMSMSPELQTLILLLGPLATPAPAITSVAPAACIVALLRFCRVFYVEHRPCHGTC